MLSPAEFIDFYTEAGGKKAEAPAARLFLLAVLAGMLIGMGAAVTNTAGHAFTNLSAARVVSGMLFPFGLILVIFTGAELFTGNCLITISVLDGRVKLSGMIRNLVTVYLGNFAGALLLAVLLKASGQMETGDGAVAMYAVKVAAGKCSLPFLRALLLGALCNFLVCIAVMCGLSGKTACERAVGAFLPVCFFVICGFEHSIANMYYISAGLLMLPEYADQAQAAGIGVSALNCGSFLIGNLLPVTIGNLIGGCSFAALLWYANRENARAAA